MSADELRKAARAIRVDWDRPTHARRHRARAFHLAVADWLDRVAGPVGIAQGNGLTGDAYDLPEALAVARTYLGSEVTA